MQVFVYHNRFYFVGKVRDLRDTLGFYKNKFSTVSDLIKNNLH
ncbi:Z-ring formation inhibitor MciZ [Desulfolucanica intricata]|nr:hypothetical protein [Desulfolucanica intricata]